MDESRVVVADAVPLWCDGVSLAVGGAGFEVVATAASVQEATLVVATGAADLVLVGNPVDAALAEAIRRLKRLRPAPLVVGFVDRRGADVAGLMRLRADGLLLRSARAAEVADVVSRVSAGERVVVTALVTAVAGDVGPARAHRGGLAAREREVLALAARGSTNKQIASELCIAEATVKSTLARTYRKLGVGSRTEAVRRAVELELFA